MQLLKTIGSRIIVTVVVLIVFAAIVGGVALYGLSTLTTGANEIIKQNEDLVFVFRAQVKIAEMVRIEKETAILGTGKAAHLITQHATLRADIQKDLEAAAEKLETETEKAKYQEIMDAVDEYDAGFARIKAALEKEAEATDLEAQAAAREEAINLTQTSSSVLAAEMNSLIGEIVAGRETKVGEVAESANAASKTMNMIEIIVLVVTIVLGIIIAFWLVTSTNKTLQGAINRLVTASDTVLGYTQQLTKQQEGLTSIVNQVSKGSANQSQLVEENTKTMGELKSSLGDTAENSKSAAKQTASASELAAKGTEAGKEAATRLQSIDEIVKKNSEVVKEVDQKADEVTNIVVTIRDVADQINLLALNAAIEAARAGEAGRGFAVVADEVRKLAETATKNVNQVGGVVKAVKDSAAQAVTNLAEGTDQVAESTKIVNNALSILDQISATSQEIASKAQEISTSNSQQTASAEQLSSALESVAASAEQNSSGAQQATASVKVVADYIQKAIKQSQDLTQLSKELQALVGGVRQIVEKTAVQKTEEEKVEEIIDKEDEEKLIRQQEEADNAQEEIAKKRRELEKEKREIEREKKELARLSEKEKVKETATTEEAGRFTRQSDSIGGPQKVVVVDEENKPQEKA